jgi:ribosomal protein S18 acetylase RimI-like enzyme
MDIAFENITAITDNFISYYMQFGKATNGEVFISPNIKLVYSGGKSLNFVLSTNANEEILNDTIEKAINFFRTREVNFKWVTGFLDKPKDLNQRLIQKGFTYSAKKIGMALDLSSFEVKIVNRDNFRFCEVASISELINWTNLVDISFNVDYNIDEGTRRVFYDLSYGANKPWTYYYIAQGVKPVSTAAVYRFQHTCGIYWVSTLPQFRRTGIANKLLCHLLLQIKREGFKRVVLQSSEMATGLYEKTGFKRYCMFSTFNCK